MTNNYKVEELPVAHWIDEPDAKKLIRRKGRMGIGEITDILRQTEFVGPLEANPRLGRSQDPRRPTKPNHPRRAPKRQVKSPSSQDT